MKWIRTRQLH